MPTIPVLQGLASEDSLVEVLASLFRKFGTSATRIPYAQRRTTSDVIVPTLTKRIRVVWVQVLPATILDPVGNKVTIKFRNKDPMYVGEVIGHQETFEGDVDEEIDIILTNTEPVDINIHYEEF